MELHAISHTRMNVITHLLYLKKSLIYLAIPDIRENMCLSFRVNMNKCLYF